MNSRSKYSILFTCEHGGNRIPRKFAARFADYQDLLQTHRGWDPGTLQTAQYFHQQFPSQLFASETSRLLVDLNRSESNPAAFSSLVPPPSQSERQEVLETYYRPWRQEVLDWIGGQVRGRKFVWHLSLHSFTPVLNDQERQAEIGLLYDPQRFPERVFCRLWQKTLRVAFPQFRIRLNYPYRGVTDGHTTTLRKKFSVDQYAGVEIEVNQRLYQQPTREVKRLIVGLYKSWEETLRETAS